MAHQPSKGVFRADAAKRHTGPPVTPKTLADEYGDTGVITTGPLCHRKVERYCGRPMVLRWDAWVCPDCGQKRFVDVSGYPNGEVIT